MTFAFLLSLGFFAGGYGALIGIAGGFLLVPLLLLLYPQMPPNTVTSISLLVVFLNAASGSVAYARQGRIDYRTGLVFALVTIPTAVAGVWATSLLSTTFFALIFGGLLFALAGFLFFRAAIAKPHHVLKVTTTRRIVDAQGVEYNYSFNRGLGLAISFGVGFVSSILGIGGGIIHVPALTLLLGFPVHIATATSLFMVSIMALSASVTHLAAGDYSGVWGIVLPLTIGGVVGAQVGAFFSQRIRARLIIRCLALGLGVVGIRLLFQAF